MGKHHDWSIWHARLQQTVKEQQFFPSEARILIAVSGGQDSVCLTKLMLDLQSLYKWRIAIAHCDHGWSTDAGIAEFVEELAANLQIPFYLERGTDVRETEAAARTWRYESLQKIAQIEGFEYVVTGHTKSDRAETFLYNLIRGAGADGLSSLNWQRTLSSNLTLIRPLLDLTRSETASFCRHFDLPLWEDAANNNLNYARNRIRKQLIPYLQDSFNPQVENNLVQTAELLQADKEYLEQQASKLLSEVWFADSKKLNRSKMREISLSLQRRIIRQLLPATIRRQPNFAQIEAIQKLIEAPNKTRTSSLPNKAVAYAEDDWIYFE